MLNQETKRKIDNARQILVGKVPDPKAQVEQITTALIYKFMDDMDKEAQELGGKARFFTNGHEKYAWTKLIDAKLGGHDRLDLYIEAITSLSRNPHIPQLFRDIFKDTFLPYRNPETLSLFLKEVNDFSYEHSEDLGDAFEYLLSILGSQGDAGQFRTPRHIIDFIVATVDPKKDETVCDPACGTAGFLISTYKYILKQHDGLDDQENKEKSLTPDERKNLMNNFVGYDISPDMVRLSKVNLYLHGFPNPTIFEYDTLSSEEKWDESFDVILANPPFMSPKGGIRPHKRFSVQANRSEVLFVDYIIEHLRPKGRAGIIVPEGIIFQSAGAYKQLRKMLVEDGLMAVVSLPAGVFNPYAGVKTSILLFDNEVAKKTKNILFLKIQNDGHSLGAQRIPIDKNDLPRALDIIKRHKQSFDDEKIYLKGKDIHDGFAHLVSKKEIAKNGEYNLSGDRYRRDPFSFLQEIMDETQEKVEMYSKALEPMRKMTEEYNKALKTLTGPAEELKAMIKSPAFSSFSKDIQRATKSMQKAFQANNIKKVIESAQYISSQQKQKWSTVELKEIADIGVGNSAPQNKELFKDGKYPFFRTSDVGIVHISDNLMESRDKLNEAGIKGLKLFPKKTILFPKSGASTFLNHRAMLGVDGYISSHLATIIPNENKILPKLLFNLLKKIDAKSLTNDQNYPSLKTSEIAKIKIPLPPIEIQKEIVEQIEKYQKIIDGAKQIIDNYRPTIKIDPDWKIIELGNLFLETKLGLVKDKSMQSDIFPFPYIKMNNITRDGNLELSSVVCVEATKEEIEKYILNDGDFIYNTRNAPNLVGKSSVYHGENGKYLFNNNILRIRFRKEADPDFINYYLNTEEGRQKIKTLISGTTSVAAIYQKNFATITVPFPPIEIQKEIVAEIMKERECVSASLKTVDIFEKKISQLINDIL